MLTLTDEQIQVIKNGYKRVQVTVSFPFENIPDITNEQIVYESLSFNESVCSSDVFRFGNAEASTVSFETVGVGNILGKVIDVKLTYEYILPEDPTNIRTFDLPYGRFTVTSCPRNHENMAHRQVQAVSRTSDTNETLLPRVEKDKLRACLITQGTPKMYEPNVWYLMDSIFGRSCEYTDSEYCTLTNYATTETITRPYVIGYSEFNGNTYEFRFEVVATMAVSELFDMSGTSSRMDALYSMTGWYDTYFEDCVDNAIQSRDWVSLNDDVIQELKNLAGFWIHFGDEQGYKAEDLTAFHYVGCVEMNDFYPNFIQAGSFMYPLSIELKFYRESLLLRDYGTINPYTMLTVTQHVATNERFPIYLSINHTLETEGFNGYNKYKEYRFYNAYDVSELATGFAEVMGGFYRTNRDGTGSIINLDNSNPYPLTASDVEGTAWWDEYVISDIGNVTYTYTDGKGDHEDTLVLEEGESIYDMTDNYFLKEMKTKYKRVSSIAKMTNPKMYYIYNGQLYVFNFVTNVFEPVCEYEGTMTLAKHILTTYFVPHTSAIHFTPIDMDIRGLPFLQCGDAITFTAADGTVINSYILNHMFTGIQHITENIDTVQGEVIE